MSFRSSVTCLPCNNNVSVNERHLNAVLKAGFVRTGVKLRSETECSICFGLLLPQISEDVVFPDLKNLDDAELRLAAREVAVLSCGHVFHSRCLKDGNVRVCPKDRQLLSTADTQHIASFDSASAGEPQRLQLLMNERQRQINEHQQRVMDAGELVRLRADENARLLREDQERVRELLEDDDRGFLDAMEQMKLEFAEEDARREREAEKRRRKNAAKKEKKEKKAAAAESSPEEPSTSATEPPKPPRPELGVIKLTRQADRFSTLWYGLQVRAIAGHEFGLVCTMDDVGEITFKSETDNTISIHAPIAGERKRIIVMQSLLEAPIALVSIAGLQTSVKTATEELCITILKSISALSRQGISVRFDAPVSFDAAIKLPRPILKGLIPSSVFSNIDLRVTFNRTNGIIEDVLDGLPYNDIIRSSSRMTDFSIPLLRNGINGGWQETFFDGSRSIIFLRDANSTIAPLRTADEAASLGEPVTIRSLMNASSENTIRVELLNGVQAHVFFARKLVIMNGVVVATMESRSGPMELTFKSVVFKNTGNLRIAIEFAKELRNIVRGKVVIHAPVGQEWPMDETDDLEKPTPKQIPLPIALGFLPIALTTDTPSTVQNMRFSVLDRLLLLDGNFKMAVEQTCTEYGLPAPTRRTLASHWMLSSKVGLQTSLVWSVAPVGAGGELVAGAPTWP